MTETTYYAVGDVHGQAHLLRKLHAAIQRDADDNKVTDAEVIYLGDYIDRGPDSKGVIDELLNSPLPFPAVHLRGNHEDMILGYLEVPGFAETFIRCGGIETLASYGLSYPNYRNPYHALMVFWETIPAEHKAFFEGLEHSHRRDKWFFCHAGLDPRVKTLEGQRTSTLLWIRDEFLDYDGKFPEGVRVVHGHTISREVQIRKNRIGIDTGSYRFGRLSAVALRPDGRVRDITVS